MPRFCVLGPVEVTDASGRPVELGGRQPRTMLALLLAAGGRTVSVEAMVDAIWGADPPASANGTLQSYVSRLRRRLDGATLHWEDAGYRLVVDPDDVDLLQFERLADDGRRLLDAGDPQGASDRLREADALWRGPAFVEFADLEPLVGVAARLDERRLSAVEDRVTAELQLGRHDVVVADLTEVVAAHPLRERFREQLALALYRSGRQAEALRVLAEAGRTLREELGIEPSRPLRELEAAILAHDPSLDPPAVSPVPVVVEPDAPAPVATARSGPAESGSLVGRTRELGELVAALDESVAGARFVVVEGEPGIGKTRLADELGRVAEARGALVTWGRADESGAAPALWPWLAPLRAVAGSTAGSIDGAIDGGGERRADRLSWLLSSESPIAAGQAESLQYERFQEVADAFAAATRASTVVVLLDDLQWADDASLALLDLLVQRLGPGALVVATMRQLEVGRHDRLTDVLASIARRPGSRRLVLRGLSPDETRALLEVAAGAPVDADMAAEIHARAEGNPFYAIELARLRDQGVDTDVPGTVGDVIRRRLAHVPEATVELLGVAAVIGRDVDLGLLAGATGRSLDEVIDLIEPGVVQRLLTEGVERPDLLRFSHALVREVLLDDLTSLRRARLHLRVADAMEARSVGADDVELLAEHLWQATPVGVGLRAASALERAAEVALTRVAYAAAEDMLARAARLRRSAGAGTADHAAELATLYRLLEVARARRYFQGAASPETLARAKELAERCGRRDLLLSISWFEWSALATSARTAEAGPAAARLAELTRDDPDPNVRATGLQVMGVLSWGRGHFDEAVAWLDRTEELLAGVPAPEDFFLFEQRLVTRTFWLFNHACHGDLPVDEAFAGFDELLDTYPDRFVRASICGFAATLAVAVGDHAQIATYGRIAAEADPGAQFAFWGGQRLMHAGIVGTAPGATDDEIDDAVARFAEGEARYLGIGARSGLSCFRAALAANLARHGRLTEAESWAVAARDELDGHGERWPEPLVLLAEGVVAASVGETDVARARFDAAERVALERAAPVLQRRVAAERVAFGC